MTNFNKTSSSEPNPIENFEEGFSGEGGEMELELTMVEEVRGRRTRKFPELFDLFKLNVIV